MPRCPIRLVRAGSRSSVWCAQPGHFGYDVTRDGRNRMPQTTRLNHVNLAARDDDAPWKESPMIQHDVSIHLNRPVDQVFGFLADPTMQPTWQSNLIEIEQLTAGP